MQDVQHQLFPVVVIGVHPSGHGRSIILSENHRGEAVRIAEGDDFPIAKATGKRLRGTQSNGSDAGRMRLIFGGCGQPEKISVSLTR